MINKKVVMLVVVFLAGSMITACDDMIVDHSKKEPGEAVEVVLEEPAHPESRPENQEGELENVNEPEGEEVAREQLSPEPETSENEAGTPPEKTGPQTPNTGDMSILERAEAWRQYYLDRMNYDEETGTEAVVVEERAGETAANDWVSLFEKVTVTRHVDGDTVVITDESGAEHRLRFIGVDTPETVHPTQDEEFYGEEASDFTKEWLLGRVVFLEKDASDTDKYGRLLRYVWLEIPSAFSDEEIREKQFNARLLLEGYASQATFPPDVKYADQYRIYETQARDNNKGLWGE